MFRLVTRFFVARLLFFAWFFLISSPLLLATWLLRDHEKLKSQLLWLTAPLGLACLLGSWWLGATTTHYLVDENRMFLDSIRRTLYDLRLRLAFVPIIGWWFAPDEDMTHHDDDDD